MSGAGVPFGGPGGGPFGGPPVPGAGQGPSSQRTGYASPVGVGVGAGVPSQLQDMMNGQMGGRSMVGMAPQMGQPYNAGMQNQMGPQSMAVGGSASSPSQSQSGMGVGVANMGSPMLSNPGSLGNTQPTANPSPNPNTTANVVASQGANNCQTNQAVGQPQQNKEFNTASLCRFGQETVQDIVSRTQEVFQTLKAIQPPNGTAQGANSSNEKKAKIQEQLRTIRLLFKRLRLIYEKCNENCQVPGMEYTHIESLIPLKEEYEHKTADEKKTSETYKLVCEENKELMEQVVLKNKQLKEVINNLRTIIWEINVMLNMRRS